MRTYFRVISFGRPYFGLGIIAIIALVVYTIFSTVTLLSAIPFLEILFYHQQNSLPEVPPDWSIFEPASIKAFGYYQLEKAIIQVGELQMLWNFCLGLLVVTVIKNAFRYLASWCISPLEQGIIENIRNTVFQHVSMLSMSFFGRKRKGDLIGVLISDVQVVQESVISTVQAVIREPIMILVLLATLIFISWKLTLFIFILLPLTAFFINLITKTLKRRAKDGQESLGVLISILDEFFSGISIVKAFQKEAFERIRYQKQNKAYTDIQVAIRRRVELASPITEVLSIGVICIIILYAGQLILGTDGTGPRKTELIGFLVIFSQLLSPIKVFSNAYAKVQKGIAAFQRLENLMAEKREITNVAQPHTLNDFHQQIEYQDVIFRYEDATVLDQINLNINKGEMIALVGASGAGKSTLVDLLPRFYDPIAGQIKIDGIDIKELKLEDLRSMIGVVTQEGILFHDSVLNNIAYGIQHPDKAKVIEAAKIANAHAFIEQLPEGYDTMIGERGTKLSGGQRQRLAIARAVLRNPSILILDEATSNLDTQSEKLVQDALQKLMQNRTSLVIAHRLSTITHADQILVMEEGKIVERGTHQELLERKGVYKQLYTLQFGGDEKAEA